jgi:hypothetical protein
MLLFQVGVGMLISAFQAHRWILQKIAEEGKSPEGLRLSGLGKTTLP